MTCRDLIGSIAGYLDGELTVIERGAFDRHLHGCRSCTAYLASYRMTIALVKAAHFLF